MNLKFIIIAIITILLIGGGSYYAYRYFYTKPKVIENNIFEKFSDDSEKNMKPKNKDENDAFNDSINDTRLQPYFDINIDDVPVGRVIFQLFDDDTPKTCKNFRYLCAKGLINKNKPEYQDTIFHRVIKDFMIQGGDVTNGDGTGGFSIYGEKFNDENFNLTHNQPGLLSMANAGPNTNNSQFFILLKEAPWLDNKHVVFGIVSSGFNVIKQIEALEMDGNDKPLKNVYITKCGLLDPNEK